MCLYCICFVPADRPITYLYNTFHYYESKLRERPNLKRRLVVAVIVSQQDIRPTNWALTEEYRQYLSRPPEDIAWNPGLSYYTALVRRLVHSILFLHTCFIIPLVVEKSPALLSFLVFIW